jgi:hypothetical protein
MVFDRKGIILRMLEKSVLTAVPIPKRKKKGDGENCIMRSFITFSPNSIRMRKLKEDELGLQYAKKGEQCIQMIFVRQANNIFFHFRT